MKLNTLHFVFSGLVLYSISAFYAPDMNHAPISEKIGMMGIIISTALMGIGVGIHISLIDLTPEVIE